MKIKTNKIISVLIMMGALSLIGFALYYSAALLTHLPTHTAQITSNNQGPYHWINWLYPLSMLILGAGLYIGSQFIWFGENKPVSI